jgi:hypothetical protein
LGDSYLSSDGHHRTPPTRSFPRTREPPLGHINRGPRAEMTPCLLQLRFQLSLPRVGRVAELGAKRRSEAGWGESPHRTARPQPTRVHLRNRQCFRPSHPHFKKLMPGALRPLIFPSSPRAARSRRTVCGGSWGSRRSLRGGPKREPRRMAQFHRPPRGVCLNPPQRVGGTKVP